MPYLIWLQKKQKDKNIFMGKVIQEVDVIAQFKYDGEIIPLRFQLINEDGKPKAYTIKGYKRIRHKSPYKSVDDILVISTTIVFECQINVQDTLSIVRLYFQPEGHIWLLGID